MLTCCDSDASSLHHLEHGGHCSGRILLQTDLLMDNLAPGIQHAAQVGYEGCDAISQREGAPWPQELAQRVLALYGEEVAEGRVLSGKGC